MNNLGLKLKQIRLFNNYRQSWVAEQFGLCKSGSGLRKIETGQTAHIKPKYLEAAKKIYNMTEQQIEDFTLPNGISRTNTFNSEGNAGIVMQQNLTNSERMAFESALDSANTSIQILKEERNALKAEAQEIKAERKVLKAEIQELKAEMRRLRNEKQMFLP